MTEAWENLFKDGVDMCGPTRLVGTPLCFTKERIEKVIQNIKGTILKFNTLNIDRLYQSLHDEDYGVFYQIPIEKKTQFKLDRLFGDDCQSYNHCEKQFGIFWLKDYENKRFFYFGRDGRSLCGSNYQDVLLGRKSYDDCPCPENFKNDCKEITKIVKKYALTVEEI
jgi:hypothetical protein